MSEGIFERAARLKIRFEYKGQIGAEDLWDLSLESLNSIYKSLMVLSRQSEGESLLRTRNSGEDVLDLKISLVKHVFEAKKQEQDERKSEAQKRLKKEKLKEILEQRQWADVAQMPASDIEKMIDELG